METENNSLKGIKRALEDIRDLLKDIKEEVKEIHETQFSTLHTLPSEDALKAILTEKTDEIIESLTNIEIRIP